MNTVWVKFQQSGNIIKEKPLHQPHIFEFIVWVEIYHHDKDIEFMALKTWCQNLYFENILVCGNKTCELIANELRNKIIEKWPDRSCRISVSRDDYFGAEIEYKIYKKEK